MLSGSVSLPPTLTVAKTLIFCQPTPFVILKAVLPLAAITLQLKSAIAILSHLHSKFVEQKDYDLLYYFLKGHTNGI